VSKEFRTYLFASASAIIGVFFALAVIHFYNDHVLIDAIRINIDRQNQTQKKVIPNAEVSPASK